MKLLKYLIICLVVFQFIAFSNNIFASNWNGKSCAFTFSTDDGNYDNLVWADVFREFDYRYTLFINSARIGTSGKLTETDLNNLHDDGFEIAAHGANHKPLNPKEAIIIQYTGDGAYCNLKLSDGFIFLDSENDSEDLEIFLYDENYDTLNELYLYLSSFNFDLFMYEYARPAGYFKYSYNLEEFDWTEIKAEQYTLTSEWGTTDEECFLEIAQSKIDLENIIMDNQYKCLTFAYPYHAHSERAIEYLKDCGYIASRNGMSTVYSSTFDKAYFYIYTIPLSEIIRNIVGNDNTFSEEETRQNVRSLLEMAKEKEMWINIYTHHLDGDNSCDEDHMRYILDEIAKDGDVWIDTFVNVSKYVKKQKQMMCDFDNDGDIDGKDLAMFAINYGSNSCGEGCLGDLDGDNDVDYEDMIILSNFFGTIIVN